MRLVAGCVLGLASASSVNARTQDAAENPAFERVAPILERRCLGCHNEHDRRGDLSVEVVDDVLAGGLLRPGDARGSRLMRMIMPVDGAARMPKDSDPLAMDEIEAIRAWIDAGATWPEGRVLAEPVVEDFDWWSYRPILRPAVPEIDAARDELSAWARTPIDAFVLTTLRERGLAPSEEADRRTLIRRLSYDLLGLPPTPTDVEDFAADEAPDAYERLVDRMLASPHYGERWARHWLDVVKYADTCGYDKDKLRPNAWPYRDYVIRSLNEDKPYGRFVQEQIAGDVLLPGEPDGILGLGFIAAGPWDFIGHVEVPESKIDGKVARNLDRDDMVSNALNAFASVTVQCARCHNHKFDPITMEQYYGLQAIFAAVDRADRPYDADPRVDAERAELGRELGAAQAELDALRASSEAELARVAGPHAAELDADIDALRAQPVTKAEAFGYHGPIATAPDTEQWVEIELDAAVEADAIRLRPCHDEFAGIGPGFGFPRRFRVEVAADDGAWRIVDDRTAADEPSPGLEPFEVRSDLGRVRRVRVTATRLAERAGDFVLALAELEVLDGSGVNRALGAAVAAPGSIEAPARWARANLTDGHWARFDDAEAGARLARALAERHALRAGIETPERIERRAALQGRIDAARAQLQSLPVGRLVHAAATHFAPEGQFKPTEGTPRPVHVLRRGDVRHPEALAEPGLLPLGDGSSWSIDPAAPEGERRAALARWLSDRDHPLVWRSIVNRVWQHHFGQGIVATPNDFGRMGAEPTHPELLDWLAVEFRDGGQSLKALHRLIVTSSVYRQSSRSDERNAAIDGSNRFLWRMNRRRLDAESMRDSILAISGALDRSMGGPGFHLFELERTEHSPHYLYHKFDPSDPAAHRRSIYRFVVRSQPDPWMTTLDCADSSQSTPRRDETLTALQALSLLNSRFNLVMAERFAARLIAEADGLPTRIAHGFRLVTQRAPTTDERDILVEYAEEHGLKNACRLMLNLNELAYVD